MVNNVPSCYEFFPFRIADDSPLVLDERLIVCFRNMSAAIAENGMEERFTTKRPAMKLSWTTGTVSGSFFMSSS